MSIEGIIRTMLLEWCLYGVLFGCGIMVSIDGILTYEKMRKRGDFVGFETWMVIICVVLVVWIWK